MAQIDDTIATYLTAIEVEGKTQNTVLSYRASLEDFRRVGRRLGFPEELATYSVEHVYRFLGDLKERGASPAYQHRRHREVKTFFSWCRRMDYVEANVFAKVALVKLDQQIRPPFSPDESQRLLGRLARANRPGCRNPALILFLLDTGGPVAECVPIRLAAGTRPGVTFANELPERVRVLACLEQRRFLGSSDVEPDALRMTEWRALRGALGAEDGDCLVVLWGPGRRPRALPEMQMLDIAPRLAELVGVTLQRPEGKSLWDKLRQ